jgi:hypothetical protein
MKKSRMQQLAGIKKNLNESFFGGYVDLHPLREMDNSDLGEGFGDKLRSVGRFAGDMLGIGKDELIDALYRKFSESDIKYTKYGEQAYSDYLNDRSAARPNFKTYLKTVDNFTIKAIAQELGLDFDDPKNLRREGDEDMEEKKEFASDDQRKAIWASYNEGMENGEEASVEDIAAAMDQAVAFAKKLAQQIADKKGGSLTQKDFFRLIDNFRSKVKDVGPFKSLDGYEDLEEGDSMSGDEGWEANTLADYFSNSEKETQDIAKQLDFLLRENCQDDLDDIVDLIIELAQEYADERINTSDLERGTFDEAKEKKGEDAEKKEKDYKGMNMSKGDVLNKMGKGKTNTVKGDRAKSYVPPHASKKDSLSESKIKPNREFLW